jgi:hypothetical protein
MKTYTWLGFISATAALGAAEPTSAWRFEELRRITAPEARQGVAADADHLYAIDNTTVAQYRKITGNRVRLWTCPPGQPLIHLNAGIVVDGILYGAHSNYPAVPHRSSIQMWSTTSLQHTRQIDLGETDGSLTWLARHESRWIACFAHYGNRAGATNRGPEHTRIVELDSNWDERRTWRVSPQLMRQVGLRGYSLSGGAFGPGGFLYVTGHDEKALYVLQFPASGDTLPWIATLAIPAEGQAFAFDPVQRDVLHLILRRTREMITGRIVIPATGGN